MIEDKIASEVTKVTKQIGLEGPAEAKTSRFIVDAKVLAPEYSENIYVVRILNSELNDHFQSTPESLMQDGLFQFATTSEMQVGDKLQILISRPPPDQVQRAL
jgi:hypothetical protein